MSADAERRPDISAIVCTHNGALLLPPALESLIAQSLDKARYEVIVVDNASTDGTADVVREFQRQYPQSRLVLLREEQLGLGHARNAGLAVARGAYVAYIDDDARAESDWLERGLECFRPAQGKPQVAGGPILPVYDVARPPWFRDAYETRSWGGSARRLVRGESLSGSNMIWDRAIIERVGGFSPRLGMKGQELSVGEETAAFDRLWRLVERPVLWYDPELIVYHWTDPRKMRPAYYLRRAFAAGQASVLMRREVLGRWGTLYLPARAVAGIIVRGVQACARLVKQPRIPNWLVEDVSPVAGHCGALVAACGIDIRLMQPRSRRSAPKKSRSL